MTRRQRVSRARREAAENLLCDFARNVMKDGEEIYPTGRYTHVPSLHSYAYLHGSFKPDGKALYSINFKYRSASFISADIIGYPKKGNRYTYYSQEKKWERTR